ncbi:protein kinase domain-containing protein [Nonomuraea indica]|uniref:protein kinase domain-containing protein n=1 Tax=Nonomuraea indica TaxID=1581193 RepID=UPI0015DE0D5A|nr:protein kinase [Nonomuraea indica]
MGDTTRLAGRYRLLNPLGGGAVRLAFDEAAHRDVAVRELRLPPESRDAAVRDARLAAGLRHPCVVPVLDVVVEGGVPWLVTEFVSGAALEGTVAARGPLPSLQAARVGVGVLAAVRTAHAAGLVHGRVNPGNVLLTATGRALLTGFGLPQAGLRPSADLWSLAATLHFAVEGRPPGSAPAAGTDPLRALIRAMLDPLGPPPVEMVAELLDRLAVERSLDQVIATWGPLPPARAAAVGLAVLDRLAAAHARGEHHGAVHPASVLTPDVPSSRPPAPGEPTPDTPVPGGPAPGAPAGGGASGGQVVPWRAAAWLVPARVAGPAAPAFRAPEGAPSPAADLWSLGATLFAAVEGHPPAPGAPLTRAGALAPVLFRLLSGDPARRGDLAALREDLRAVAALA